MKTNLTASLVGALIAAPLPAWTMPHCLEYGRNDLYGTLVRQTYPGPPDYKSIKRGDQPRVIWVLLLDELICVVDPDHESPTEKYQREVQLVLEDDQYELYLSLLGNKVAVTGDLRHTRGDYKRLRIVAHEITRAR